MGPPAPYTIHNPLGIPETLGVSRDPAGPWGSQGAYGSLYIPETLGVSGYVQVCFAHLHKSETCRFWRMPWGYPIDFQK